MIRPQLRREEILNQTYLLRERGDGYGLVRCLGREDEAGGRDWAGVLGLVGAVHAVLEQMQGDREGFEAEFFCQSEFAEAEEVFVEVFGEVAADELVAAVVEGADAVCACVVA